MKTLLFVLLVIFATTAGSAQSKSDKMYDAFANKAGVTHFSFSKNMIDAVDLDLGDEEDERQVTGDLHRIRFMSYNPEKGKLSGSEFTRKAVNALPGGAYKKYIDPKEDNNAEIWLQGKRKKFKECHVFLTNEREDQMRFVISFYGDFTVNDVNALKKAGKEISDE